MKIINIICKTKNEYEIELEKRSSFLIFDETILNFNITVGKDLNNQDIINIKKYNNLMKEYFNCSKKIKLKLRTEQEIIDYLSKKAFLEDEIKIILSKLKKSNLLDDNRYIVSYINDRLNLTFKGPLQIKKELIQKGFSEEKINLFLNKININSWMDRINKYVMKKIKENRKFSGKELQYKLNQDLIYLGHLPELIDTTLNEFNISNKQEVLAKEYAKLRKKYFKKALDLKKINLKIKYDLLYKGYTEDEINNIFDNEKTKN